MKKIEYPKRRAIWLYSLLFGFIYFLWTIGFEYNDGLAGLYSFFMLFLPGLTFPLTSAYYSLDYLKNKDAKILIHLILSVAIYHGAVWAYTSEGHYKLITLAGAFMGSLLYQLCTKLLLQRPLKYWQIILTALISGLSFLPYEIIDKTYFFLGLGVFLWTVINGLLAYITAINYYRQQNV